MPTHWDCLGDAELLRLADRPDDPGEQAAHVRGCRRCRRRMARTRREQATLLNLATRTHLNQSAGSRNRVATVTHDADPQPAAETPRPAYVGRYPVRGRLARGGQAELLLATHPTLGRDIVLKLTHDAVDPSPAAKAAIEQEGRLLARINHPVLPAVYDCDVHDGRPFVALELVDGVSLRDWTALRQPTVRDILKLLIPLSDALATAHDQGILHLDLNPDNVLIQPDQQPRLLDFGAAGLMAATDPLSDVGCVVGTPEYMAPEQHTGDRARLTPATDIHGLGGLLYFLLYGEAPHAAGRVLPTFVPASSPVWGQTPRGDQTDSSAATDHLRRRALQAVCRRALAPDPDGRPATARLLADELIRLRGEFRRSICRRLVAAVLLLFGLANGMAAVAAWRLQSSPSDDVLTVAPVVYRAGTPVALHSSLPLQSGDELQIQLRGITRDARLFVILDSGVVIPCGPLTTAAATNATRWFPAENRGWPLGELGSSLLILATTDQRALPAQVESLRRLIRRTPLTLPADANRLEWRHDDDQDTNDPADATAELPPHLRPLAAGLKAEFAHYHALVLRSAPSRSTNAQRNSAIRIR